MMFRLVGFLLWPLFWLMGKLVWYSVIALAKLMYLFLKFAQWALVALFVGVPLAIAKGAAEQRRARPHPEPSHSSPSRPNAPTPGSVKPVSPARNIAPPKPSEEPIDVDVLVRQNRRRDRLQADREWYRMWDEALTPAEQAEKRTLQLEHQKGGPTSNRSFGLFPGDYIPEELKLQKNRA
ncbi:hypothetical protein [Arthrobacter sp. 2MCAF14]|uniref:hypothetical protein n=1 Tax=Arthrobacter sp. 2MCAF14 TaxID=3232982 RepID=UPI003F9165A0